MVVGYRRADRRSHLPGATYVGDCISCGAPTFFVPSGQDAVRHRDAQIMCDEPCYQRHKDQVQREL